MNVHKRLDRFKQWAGERMGGEARTDVSDDFKALEAEMGLRHDGMKDNQKAMSGYVKALSKRGEGEDKEKVLAVEAMGQAMSRHGDEFEDDSEFGRCLVAMGRTNERVARYQETFVAQSTSTWLESMDRSLVQMKEYQNARKKLESRRLAYDTASTKLQKSKREDFRAEEELRAQKAKFEESSEDVYRRMLDIREAEADSVLDLGEFLDAQLSYYQRCHEALAQLKREWPAGHDDSNRTRSRSNTCYSARRFDTVEEEPAPPPQPARPIQPAHRALSYGAPTPQYDGHVQDVEETRPSIPRAATIAPETTPFRAPAAPPRPAYNPPSGAHGIIAQKAQLRSVSKLRTDVAPDDPSDASTYYSASTSSPDRFFGPGGGRERSVSPATSYGSAAVQSRNASSGNLAAAVGGVAGVGAKKPPPPPPPSRAKKPPPPPPPMRRVVSAGVGYA